ncbi:MAG: TlpA family protein disulfide reductase [Candidatus Abyssobacteria bacterium SURF_5]|uniref:TlpA family protein disulfide reductase n=1 Tax=Abyssobacteria bacterium (strain SURF_5) TaxID=2093360 RepID=A0A3A4NEZ9_ABYX5|nr:MAG: TlpA family protein disulfide reductase [Candidatus Abyssubacteria bacterium SURF_5]
MKKHPRPGHGGRGNWLFGETKGRMSLRCWKFRGQSIILFVVALVIVFSHAQGLAQNTFKIPGDATARTLDGKQASISDYKGKLIFLSLWKIDCPPCLMEIPILNRLQKEYSSDDFTVIGVSLDRGKEEMVSHIVKRADITYPVWLAYDQPILKYLDAPFTPFLFVLGPDGEVLGYYPGKIPTYNDAVTVMNEARKLVDGEQKRK